MRRSINRQIVVVCVLLFSFVGNAVVANAQATDLHDAATQLTKKLHDDPDVKKIANEHIVIAPFENINGKGDAVPRILQEMLTTSFIKAKHFKVLERDQLQSALDELHFQLSDLADPAKAKKIGKLAGATYVLLGSISDTGSNTSINARIVSIESGESVAAEDVDIKTGDAASGVGGLNPTANPLTISPETTAPTIAPKPQTPAIDLNAKATPTTAGEYIGQKNNFGLLGGTKFQIAWREALGDQPVYSFSAGDLLGDGGSRLALFKKQALPGDVNQSDMASALQTGFVPYLQTSCLLTILKWNGQVFNQTWQSTTLSGSGYGGGYSPVYVRVLPIHGKAAPVFLSSFLGAGVLRWVWDGTTYVWDSVWGESTASFGSITETMPASTKNLLYLYSNQVAELNYDINAIGKPQMPFPEHVSLGSRSFNEAVTANFDGAEKTEIATAVYVNNTKEPTETIEIYGSNGTRKAVTANKYGPRLAVWNPTAFKYPFLVAMRNTFDADGKASGGYVYFIQWNGESFDEVWKSNRIDDSVIDMQVCDPKGEGKPGLVILSADKKGCYLTKIVHAN